MAQFEACTFNFANDSSINYGVYMAEFNGNGGVQTESAGSNINVISDSIPRCAEQYIYGIEQKDIQQFNITIGSDKEKSRAEIDRIISWLIQPTPQYLCINQFDMQFYRYKGFFTNPQLISVGKRPFGLQVSFVSMSPFAYTFPNRIVKEITVPTTFVFNNESGDTNYLYPTLFITPNNAVQSFSIINSSDNEREFKFTFESPFPDGSEIITIDNKLQLIQSNMGSDFSRRRFTQFNMKWFRLLRGKNELKVTGNGKLEIEYVFARRIGA